MSWWWLFVQNPSHTTFKLTWNLSQELYLQLSESEINYFLQLSIYKFHSCHVNSNDIFQTLWDQTNSFCDWYAEGARCEKWRVQLYQVYCYVRMNLCMCFLMCLLVWVSDTVSVGVWRWWFVCVYKMAMVSHRKLLMLSYSILKMHGSHDLHLWSIRINYVEAERTSLEVDLGAI